MRIGFETAGGARRRTAALAVLVVAWAWAAAAPDARVDLYISNQGTSSVDKVGPGGGVATTFATGFNGPDGLAFDASGNLYVANRGVGTVSKVTPGGSVSTFATGLNNPRFLAFSPAAVPEPSSLVLMTTGLAGVAAWVRRRRR
jgi:sugar lactone lactonase YvrE